MRDAEHIRKLMEALNERGPEVPYQGKHADNPNIEYDTVQSGGEIKKVIARLTSDPSGRYTKLGRNLLRMERINERIKVLKDEVKQESRELIADLFNADDACRTREVETVSFIFNMTKDPEATVTYKYAKILEELEKHFTPELVEMKKKLMEEFETVTKKAPAIRVAKDKAEESLEEAGLGDMWQAIKAMCRKFYSQMLVWGQDYDHRLDMLKAQVAMGESVLDEKKADHNRGDSDIKWGTLFGKAVDHVVDKLTGRKEKKAYDQHKQRKSNKAYIDQHNALRNEGLEDGNPLLEYSDEEEDDDKGLDVGTGHWDDDGMSVQWVEDELDEDGDWHDQDDFQTYNDNEADDYRNEGDDEADEGSDPEQEVVHSLALLGLHPASMSSKSKQQMLALISELDSFAHLVSAHWSEGDQAISYYCEDPGSVNQGVKLATAWIDENGDFYYEI